MINTAHTCASPIRTGSEWLTLGGLLQVSFIKKQTSPGWCVQWLELGPAHRRVVDSIPSQRHIPPCGFAPRPPHSHQGVRRRPPVDVSHINVCLSLPPPFYSVKKQPKKCPQVKIKQTNKTLELNMKSHVIPSSIPTFLYTYISTNSEEDCFVHKSRH